MPPTGDAEIPVLILLRWGRKIEPITGKSGDPPQSMQAPRGRPVHKRP